MKNFVFSVVFPHIMEKIRISRKMEVLIPHKLTKISNLEPWQFKDMKTWRFQEGFFMKYLKESVYCKEFINFFLIFAIIFEIYFIYLFNYLFTCLCTNFIFYYRSNSGKYLIQTSHIVHLTFNYSLFTSSYEFSTNAFHS